MYQGQQSKGHLLTRWFDNSRGPVGVVWTREAQNQDSYRTKKSDLEEIFPSDHLTI